MLETSVLGLGQDLGLITALGGAKTTLAYVSRIVFDLIPSRFKVRDRRRSPRGLLHNQCGVTGGMTAFSDVTEGKERQKPASRRAKK
ncbi:hypothetical protein YC2023_018617 [Brassica napus]